MAQKRQKICFDLQRNIYLRAYKEMNTKIKFNSSSHAQKCHRIRNISEPIFQHLPTTLLQPICAKNHVNVV